MYSIIYLQHWSQVLCPVSQLPEVEVSLLKSLNLFLFSLQSVVELQTHRDTSSHMLTEDDRRQKTVLVLSVCWFVISRHYYMCQMMPMNRNQPVLLKSRHHTFYICHTSKQRITRWLTSIESPSVLPLHWVMSLHRAPSCADGSPASGGELTKLSSGDKSHWGVRGGMTHPWNGTSSAGDRLLSSVEGESDRGRTLKLNGNTTQHMLWWWFLFHSPAVKASA